MVVSGGSGPEAGQGMAVAVAEEEEVEVRLDAHPKQGT